MEPKGIFKILANEKERIMHYTTDGKRVLALSLNNTDLIEDIKNDENVLVTFGMKGTEQIPAAISIVDDEKQVRALFDKMLEENNTYFKEFDDRLIVLEVNIK